MGSFSATHWVIFGLIVFALFKMAKAFSGPSDNVLFCKSCGHSGQPTKRVKGSFLIELVLWLCFIIPGLIYSLWRISSRSNVCASCQSSDLVPPNSPVAIATKKQLGIDS